MRAGAGGKGRAGTAFTAALLLLALAGCQQTEPYVRAGEWHPLGANAANLRAMIADPHDLYMGRDPVTLDGGLGAAAVARLRADKVKKLPASSISSVKAYDTGGQNDPGNAPTAEAPVAAPTGGGAAQ